MRYGVISDTDETLAISVESWIAKGVDCVFGRREHAMDGILSLLLAMPMNSNAPIASIGTSA